MRKGAEHTCSEGRHWPGSGRRNPASVSLLSHPYSFQTRSEGQIYFLVLAFDLDGLDPLAVNDRNAIKVFDLEPVSRHQPQDCFEQAAVANPNWIMLTGLILPKGSVENLTLGLGSSK